MSELLPFLVVGIANGSVYALAGMGLVLTYKTSGIFNFAHGAQAAAAAYLMYDLRDQHGWPWPLAALTALVVVGLLGGLLLERLAAGLSGSSTATRVVATIGLLVGLQALLVIRYGASVIRFDPFLPTGVVRLPGVNVRWDQILVTVLALAVGIGLVAFFRRARLGLAMQAVVADPALLSLDGSSPIAVRRRAWVIGSCFAATSGLLLAPTIGLDATILTLLVVQAFGAAAVGAFTSMLGTYAGGIAVGVGAAVATKYIGGAGPLRDLPSTLPFLVLFVALLVTPRHRLVDLSAAAARQPIATPRALPRPALVAGGAIGAVFLLLAPWIAGSRLPLYSTGLGFVVLFASLALLVRTSGQVSLCHMAFAAVGAATSAHAVAAGLPWPIAVLAGGLVAAPVGALVAIPAIRLSGVYLAVATFGFGILVQRIAFPSALMFGQQQQVEAARPHLDWLTIDSDTGYYYVVLAVAAGGCAVAAGVRRSRLGRLLRGLAESPTALTAHGTNVNLVRLYVFCVSAFLAGVAGAVLGPITGSATGPTFDFSISLLLLAVLAVAGRRPLLSAVVAAGAHVVAPAYLTNPTLVKWMPVLFGTAALAGAVGPGRGTLARWLGTRRSLQRDGRSRLTARPAPAPVLEVAAP